MRSFSCWTNLWRQYTGARMYYCSCLWCGSIWMCARRVARSMKPSCRCCSQRSTNAAARYAFTVIWGKRDDRHETSQYPKSALTRWQSRWQDCHLETTVFHQTNLQSSHPPACLVLTFRWNYPPTARLHRLWFGVLPSFAHFVE